MQPTCTVVMILLDPGRAVQRWRSQRVFCWQTVRISLESSHIFTRVSLHTNDTTAIPFRSIWCLLCTNYHWDWFFLRIFRVSSRCLRPHGQRRRSAAARLLGLRVQIPPGAWMFLSCEFCVLLGRGLCHGLITRPEESYWIWCVCVWSRNLNDGEA
jgi:hypothetical protein